MYNPFLVLVVINSIQVFATEEQLYIHHVHKRTPQNIDIQSISQKKISPDITVVDVVVNEPTRGRYPNQNPYIQPGYPTPNNNFNYYPNRDYQNVPNRRQQEFQIIEVVDPRAGSNYQPWQRYPGNQGQLYPSNPSRYPGNNQLPVNPNRYPGNPGNRYPGNPGNRYPGNRPGNWPNRPNRRPYRPTPDFFIQEENQDDNDTPPRRGNGPPDRPGNRPRPNKNNNASDESSDEDRYIFDAGEGTIAGYTKENFPIIPLHKNDIRR